jgi:hypothetical protein
MTNSPERLSSAAKPPMTPGARLLRSPPEKEQRGSRARCIRLTDGSNEDVAGRLSALAAPFAVVDPHRHQWMPRGRDEPKEAKLGNALSLLSEQHRKAITAWWLAVPRGANTPNWDIASTATIDGAEGLLLVEAKAHVAEMSHVGKPHDGNGENHLHIGAACLYASDALNGVMPGWKLSMESHYQLCNRFAWAWKLASLGIPVALVYLGFVHAKEMPLPFADAEHWERLVRGHSKGIVPDAMWAGPIMIDRTPLHAVIRAMEVPLDRP